MQIEIDNPEDERLNHYRNIRERDLVKNQRHFIAEGKTVLQVLALQNRFKLQSVLILQNRLAGLAEFLSKIDGQIPVYVVPKPIIDEVAGFPMHRGVLAIGQAPSDIAECSPNASQWRRVVVLSGLSNHDNVGAIFRNAAAFDVDAVLLDPQCCDPLYRKAIRVSVGGVFKVPYYFFQSPQAITEFLSQNDFEIVALSPQAKSSLQQWKPAAKSAFILGTEGQGLPAETLDRWQTIKVEMAADFDSLNVATTGAIALHHMAIHQA